MNKKHIFIWSLYDFANSFVFITFLIYFSKWMVVNQGLSDWWYNATFIIGSIGLIFFAPWLGNKADKIRNGKRYLVYSTLGCFVFYALAIISALAGLSIFWSAFCFGLGNFFYQLSFVFYNPLLNNISNAKNRGKISGIGFLSNYAGQICGLLTALPFISGKISLGIDPLIAGLIPATIIFIILSIPLLINKEIYTPKSEGGGSKIGLGESLRMLVALPGVLVFAVSFFLFNDAVTTIINNFSIFTSSVYKTADSQISSMILLVIVFAGVGAPFWGWLADKIGAKKALSVNLISWIVIIPCIAWLPTFNTFFIFAVLSGLCIGGTFSVARLVLIELVPPHILNSGFGVYAISERASTMVGPLAWSMVLAVGGYRWAMFSMVFFQIVSVILILKLARKNSLPVSAETKPPVL